MSFNMEFSFQFVRVLVCICTTWIITCQGKLVCPLGHWGPDCRDPCSSSCGNRGCHVNGTRCLDFCHGSKNLSSGCQEACLPGTFGPDCTFSCSDRCLLGSCDPRDGRCLAGCQEGLKWPYCTDNAIIIGLGVGMELLALTIIAILLYGNRKRLTALVPNSESSLPPPPLSTVTYGRPESGYENPVESVRVHEKQGGGMPVSRDQGDVVGIFENQGDTAREYENNGTSLRESGVTENSTYDSVYPRDIDFSSPNL